MSDSSVLKIFSDRQRQNELEKKQRTEEVYGRIPEIKKIDEEISEIAVAATKQILAGKREVKTEASKKVEELISQKKALLKSGGFREDYTNLRYHCDKCRDTGYLENGKRCTCFFDAVIKNNVEKFSLKKLLLEQNFDTFNLELFSDKPYRDEKLSPRENMKENLKFANKFVANCDNPTYNLFFYGETGTGKTFMSSAIAKDFLYKGKTAVYQSMLGIVEVSGDSSFRQTNKETYDSFLNSDLLIIDDLGSELTNEFTKCALFDIINSRMNNGKKMIISSNLSVDTEIQRRYSERIYSRLTHFVKLKFYGEDLRRKV